MNRPRHNLNQVLNGTHDGMPIVINDGSDDRVVINDVLRLMNDIYQNLPLSPLENDKIGGQATGIKRLLQQQPREREQVLRTQLERVFLSQEWNDPNHEDHRVSMAIAIYVVFLSAGMARESFDLPGSAERSPGGDLPLCCFWKAGADTEILRHVHEGNPTPVTNRSFLHVAIDEFKSWSDLPSIHRMVDFCVAQPSCENADGMAFVCYLEKFRNLHSAQAGNESHNHLTDNYKRCGLSLIHI